MRGSRAATAMWTLFLAACTTTTPQAFDPVASTASLARAGTGDPWPADALTPDMRPAPGQPWDIDALVALAWARRPELAEARALHRAAQADGTAVALGPPSQWSFSSEFIPASPADVNPWVIAAAMAWMIEAPGVRQARRDQADARIAASGRHWAEAAWQMAVEVRAAATALALAQQFRAADVTVASVAVELKDLDALRLQLNAIGAEQAALTRVSAEQAQRVARESTARVALRRAQLAAALGVPAADLPPLASIALESAFAADTADVDLSADVARRLDVAAAVADHAAADARVQELAAARWPDLVLTPSIGRDRGETRGGVALGGSTTSAARQDAALQAATAQREALAQRIVALESNALASGRQALTELAGLRDEVAALQAEQAARQQMVEIAERRFRAGASDRASVLAARDAALKLERARLSLVERQLAAIAGLEAAIQAPLWPPSALAAQALHSKEPGR